MAALNAVLDGWDQTPFRYADTFAGHPVNPLKDQPRYEWQRGVGRLRDRATIGEGVDQDSVTNWIRLYLGKSQLVDTEYPGSARVASDICAKRGVDFRLILWDTNPDVVTELRGEFASPAHSVHDRPADEMEEDVANASFVFIDPPRIEKPFTREKLYAFLGACKDRLQPVLVWLPVNAVTNTTPPSEDKESFAIRGIAIGLGYGVTKVRWDRGGRTFGCQLLYYLPRKAAEAVRAAVDKVVAVAGWREKDLPCEPVIHWPVQAHA